VSTLAFGVKAHSGWAALVAVGEEDGRLEVALRRRLELASEPWAKQPYHAAEGLDAEDAEDVVARAVAAAHACAEQGLAAALAERCAGGDEVIACGVLLGAGMPPWSTREILAVHMRMHKAEGELFREALLRGAERAGLPCIGVREKEVEAVAAEALRLAAEERERRLGEAGRRAGPPWARDQKDAALAAWIALRRARRG
jgi:hypothetical protein